MINQTSETTLVQGTVAASAVHVATVATGAFAFIDAIDLSPYVGCKLTLRDSTGRTAVGYVMRAGTGEALDGELVDAWTNNVSYPFETWTPGAGAVITQAANTAGGYGAAYKAIAAPNGKLFKSANTYALAGGTAPILELSNGNAGAAPFTIFSLNATSYGTGKATQAYLIWASKGTTATDFSVSAFSFQRVTEPPATGVVIASTKGGSTQTWAGITTGFDPNAVTFYSISRVHVATVVASGNLGAGDGGLVLTDGSAKAVPTGVDISGYAGGYYFLTFQDTGGRVYGGYSGSVSDGTGLTIVTAKAGATQNWLIKTASFDKDVALAYKVYHIGY